MNNELQKQGTTNYLGIVAVVMGVLCITVAVIMTYYGKTMSLGNIPIAASLAFLVAGLVLIIVASLIGRSRQKHQQVSIRLWHVFLPILIVFLVVYFSTRYSLQGNDKYTVLVDLILIMLAVSGMIGYGIYRWISRSVNRRVALAIKEGRAFTRSQVETLLGFWYFTQYEAEVKRTEEMYNIWKKLSKIQSDQEDKEDSEPEHRPTDVSMTCLEYAITSTTRALGLIKGWEDKYEKAICTCKNNLAYYLAEKRRKVGEIDEIEKKLAIEYATFIWGRIQKYPSHKANWADTYEFVRKQFPSEFP